MIAIDLLGFQPTPYQFIASGVLGLLLCFYSLSLPKVPVSTNKSANFMEATGLKAFSLFKDSQMAIFFIFSMLLGAALQITNGFANPFITQFGANEAFTDTFGVKHANILISISQMSETLCILLIPFFMKKLGIKKVMLIAMFAWVFRFGFFGIGNPEFPGVIWFILSMLVYGVAFDFFNISGTGNNKWREPRYYSRQYSGIMVHGVVYFCRLFIGSRIDVSYSFQRSWQR